MGDPEFLCVFRVAHEFHKLPDEVRSMTVADFTAAVAFIELLDEARRDHA